MKTGNPPSVTHETETIDPAKAAHYLTFNTRNRPIRLRRVDELALEMRENRWEENGESGITFDWNGELAGGQHTLSAVVKTGATIRCRVSRGVKPEARTTMNNSVPQRLRDDLSIAGVGNSERAEALLRKVAVFQRAAAADAARRKVPPAGGRGGLALWRFTRFTRTELAAEWPRYAAGIVNAISFAAKWRDDFKPGNTGALDFMAWLLLVRYGCAEGIVTDFFDRLTFGSTEAEDKVIVRAVAKFLDPNPKKRSAEYQVWWMMRAWTAWTGKEELSKLQLPKGQVDKLADPFPRIRTVK